ncbi:MULTISPECIES: AAA family ATPase [Enterobacter]|uniref:AAA family ATPase n=1 Tax=Enterobacter TaxID=547 RepID=UPI00090821F3|nr:MULTISPECIES: AAA family ATPase [Enterobacter]QLW19770.1 AAA family ATPase [Enterobacter cloacae]MDL0001933.1 AAA family ATPase [Enterobacter roggenkampii]MDU2770311.1 AAA family ATPase [Enterobacter sp.]MDU2842886.1 AAA family ATPase [Enterobacter sp.]MDU2879692.1 AAA family ATPase [Enterobacter sp.]
MILIQKIEINGFKSPTSKLSVLLSGSNISVIYGDNGSGKTTFLKILHSILEKDESILIQNKVSSVVLYYSYPDGNYDRTTIKRKYESSKRSDSLKKNESSEYNWTDFLNSPLAELSSLSLGVERGVINQASRIEPRQIYDYFVRHREILIKEVDLFSIAHEMSTFLRVTHNKYKSRSDQNQFEMVKKNLHLQSVKIENIESLLLEKYKMARITATKRIQSALFDTLSIAITLNETSVDRNHRTSLPNDFERRLIENKERIIEALDDGEENKFKNKVIQILSDDNIEEEVSRYRHHEILGQLFMNMMNELELEKQMLSSINLLIDTFNRFLIQGKELIIKNEHIYVKVGRITHSISELSSGERHILTFLCLVLFEGGKRNILIIDEPEISLNIKWQRELLSLFSELIPQTQIIVASHSPSLANRNPQFLCELNLSVG